jgi:uncharacterized protein (TIGR03000 family)
MRSWALSPVGIGALVGAAFVAATSSGWAQSPGGSRLIHQGYYNNGNYNYLYFLQHRGYYNPRAYQPRYLFYPSRGGGYPWYNYRPYYGWHFPSHMTEPQKEEQPETPKDTHAHILVRVPAGAKLWFNGTKVSGEETDHKFVSPSLTPGRRYSYEVRAEWQQNGQTITKTHELSVKAGARIEVDLTKMDDKEK